jgi:hypothetical protein
MSLREFFSLKVLGGTIAILAGLVAVISFLMTVYSAVEKSGSVVLVRIDKDLNTIPELLASAPGVNAADREMYKSPEFGAVRVEIYNRTNQNFDGPTLAIKNLRSLQGVRRDDNFLDDTSRSQFDQRWNRAKFTPPPTAEEKEWTALVLPLPRIMTGAYLKLSVYGLNALNADADLNGAGPIHKQYQVRVPDSWRLRPWYEYLLVSVSIVLLAAAATLLDRVLRGHAAP